MTRVCFIYPSVMGNTRSRLRSGARSDEASTRSHSIIPRSATSLAKLSESVSLHSALSTLERTDSNSMITASPLTASASNEDCDDVEVYLRSYRKRLDSKENISELTTIVSTSVSRDNMHGACDLDPFVTAMAKARKYDARCSKEGRALAAMLVLKAHVLKSRAGQDKWAVIELPHANSDDARSALHRRIHRQTMIYENRRLKLAWIIEIRSETAAVTALTITSEHAGAIKGALERLDWDPLCIVVQSREVECECDFSLCSVAKKANYPVHFIGVDVCMDFEACTFEALCEDMQQLSEVIY